MNRRIAIVGGGPGGLTLARILALHGQPTTVFELDAHALARPQGGSLDLHTGSGLRAVGDAELTAEFETLARYDDQSDAIYDPSGRLHFRHDGDPQGGRPEIDRTQLRDMFLASLPEGTVRWGSKVVAIEPLRDGVHRLHGEKGALGEFDLVVGADGAWSKVRPLVSSATPAYTGVLFIELTIDRVDEAHPELAKLLPNGKLSVAGRSQALIAQRSSGGHVRVYVMFRVAADWAERGGLDLAAPDRARAQLKAQLAGWSPALLRFVDECNDVIVPRPIVALPVGHRWTHRPGITLLGDAAHVMSPFSGEGVNMAMLDGATLAEQLLADADTSAAVSRYEETMFVRSAEAAQGAHEGLGFVSDDALEHALEHFRDVIGAQALEGGGLGGMEPPPEGFVPSEVATSSIS